MSGEQDSRIKQVEDTIDMEVFNFVDAKVESDSCTFTARAKFNEDECLQSGNEAEVFRFGWDSSTYYVWRHSNRFHLTSIIFLKDLSSFLSAVGEFGEVVTSSTTNHRFSVSDHHLMSEDSAYTISKFFSFFEDSSTSGYPLLLGQVNCDLMKLNAKINKIVLTWSLKKREPVIRLYLPETKEVISVREQKVSSSSLSGVLQGVIKERVLFSLLSGKPIDFTSLKEGLLTCYSDDEIFHAIRELIEDGVIKLSR